MRELLAVWVALQSFGPFLRGKAIQWNTDNKGVASIIPKGSMLIQLHELAIKIFQFCTRNRISLRVEWIPRGENDRADLLSRIQDFDDWQVSHEFFLAVEQEFQCRFSVDRFADHRNRKCVRFNSRFYVPGTEGVNAFAFDWSGEENWLVPPISCVSKVLDHVSLTKSNAVLVTPAWKSAVFWPKVFPLGGKHFPGLVRAFTVPGEGVFRRGN